MRSLFAVLAGALIVGASGCGCHEAAFFPTQCSRVRVRAEKALGCPSLRTRDKDPSSVEAHSADDADTYTVCCNFGSRACAYYVCPKGRPDSACYRMP